MVSNCKLSPCPVTAKEAVCELSPCPVTAKEAVSNALAACHVTVKETVTTVEPCLLIKACKWIRTPLVLSAP